MACAAIVVLVSGGIGTIGGKMAGSGATMTESDVKQAIREAVDEKITPKWERLKDDSRDLLSLVHEVKAQGEQLAIQNRNLQSKYEAIQSALDAQQRQITAINERMARIEEKKG